MKLLRAKVENFGSYESLEFSFEDLGLALLYGATGSGKSTLMDVALWILWGTTAKDGNADDVRNWSNLDRPTKGEIYVDLGEEVLRVVRIRGSTRDLWWEKEGSCNPKRGKDLSETQKLLNERLGCDSSLYLLGAYSCETSPARRFFEAKAKERKELLDSCVDLSWCRIFVNNIRSQLSGVNGSRESLTRDVSRCEAKLQLLSGSIRDFRARESTWKEDQEKKRKEIEEKSKKWEKDKEARLESLKALMVEPSLPLTHYKELTPCSECGQDKSSKLRLELMYAWNRYHDTCLRYKDTQKETNPYSNLCLEQNNPYGELASKATVELAEKTAEYEKLSWDLAQLERTIAGLDQLKELSDRVRGFILEASVLELEAETNSVLATFLGGVFRVKFTVASGDSIDIDIRKDGYECSFRQLSKGQKGCLRLAFTVALMKRVSKASGVEFENLFFDEALDGLDPDLKLSAIGLFQELSKEKQSVIVIEHSSKFRNNFDKQFKAEIQGDYSKLEEV